MTKHPDPLAHLKQQLATLPGIGPKAAERIVDSLLRRPVSDVRTLGQTLSALPESIRRCQRCGNTDSQSPCSICVDAKRDATVLCVVAEPADIRAIEKTGEYHGRYHVLQGLLNPLEGVTPEDLAVAPLLKRLQHDDRAVHEVILALDPTVEGEATSLYLQKALARLAKKVTKLARGLPLGAELEYADEMTLGDAIRGRRELR